MKKVIDWEAQKQIGIDALNLETERKKSPAGGQPRSIPTPGHMWKHACDYFADVDANPLIRQDFLRGGAEAGKLIDVAYPRPYTWKGFEAYLFLSGVAAEIEQYKYNYEGYYEEYVGVVARIDAVMYRNKYDGAAVGAFNASIISRDLGLSEKTETKVTMEQPLFPDDEE